MVDLTLCLTPDKFKQIPQAYSGEKMHFNMSCSSTFFEDRDKLKNNPAIRQIIRKMEKYDTVAGYVGTLSMRRLDDELLEHLASRIYPISCSYSSARATEPRTPT